ncbi:MAG: penicillin-binding transpeptidase domain-containing protein, partial [Fidelibacterota bacterium]
LEEHKLSFPGILFNENPARTYVSDSNLSHTLGYLRTVTENILKNASPALNYLTDDVYGAAGLEKKYEEQLRGKNGLEYHRVDIFGRDHGVVNEEDRFPPKSGHSLQISIDSHLQSFVESKLEGLRGAIIAMDPRSGEILVFASAPDYPLNSFVGPIPSDLWNSLNTDKNKPLVNRGVNGLYPPGSTFKLVAASLIMESELINPYYKVQCNGVYTLGERDFHCWNPAGHGQVNLKSAIKYSCNIYFYKVIQSLIFSQWSDMAFSYGFGKKTGIDLPFESEGIVPTEAYLNEKYTRRGWSTGNLLSFVIGQGDVLSTPLQMLQMINLIATKGHTFQPHFNMQHEKIPVNLELKPKTWTFLQDAMFEVVNAADGTGRNAKIASEVKIWGKTGTSQNPHGDHHSSFAGYMETSNGNLFTLYIMIENGGKGSGIATSLASDIFNFYSSSQSDVASNY